MPANRTSQAPTKLELDDFDTLNAAVRRIEAIALLLGPIGATEHEEPLQRVVVAEVAMIILDETTRIRTVLKAR